MLSDLAFSVILQSFVYSGQKEKLVRLLEPNLFQRQQKRLVFFIYSWKKLCRDSRQSQNIFTTRENVLAPSCLKVTFSPPINTSFGRGEGGGEGASLYLSLFIIGEFNRFFHGCSKG
jgi:hypothetical protein